MNDQELSITKETVGKTMQDFEMTGIETNAFFILKDKTKKRLWDLAEKLSQVK
jgi:hypothetical protein